MVVGSGGGSESYKNPYGGHGGELTAENTGSTMIGGSQTIGRFGFGSDGKDDSVQYPDGYGGSTAGSGAGYRGGLDYTTFGGNNWAGNPAAGGSSYISGHEGCKSPNPEPSAEDSIDNNIQHSGLFFKNTEMISGSKVMPSIYYITTKGHSGNGEARITVLSNDYYCIENTCDFVDLRFLGFIITPPMYIQ